MNHMIHIAAISQIRLDTEGRAYYRRKRAEGKRPMEALRCLKRRIPDAIYRQLVADATRRGIRARERGPGRAPRGVSCIQRGRLIPHTRTSDQPLPGPAPTTRRPPATRGKTEPEKHLQPAG